MISNRNVSLKTDYALLASYSGGSKTELKKGTPEPLGVSAAGACVNFAVSVPGATEVTLLLYRGASAEPEISVTMDETDRFGAVFCVAVKLPAETPEGGWQYEYETKGERFVDPYTRLLAGRERFGKRLTQAAGKLVRGVVRTQVFRWNGEVDGKIYHHNVYNYVIEYNTPAGSPRRVVGSITVL